jgi:hypothetical protein
VAYFYAINLIGTRELLALYHTGVGHRYTPTPLDLLSDLHSLMLFKMQGVALSFLRSVARDGKLLGPNFNELSPDLFEVIGTTFNLVLPKPSDTCLPDATGYVITDIGYANTAHADARGELIVKDMDVVLRRLDAIEKRLGKIETSSASLTGFPHPSGAGGPL